MWSAMKDEDLQWPNRIFERYWIRVLSKKKKKKQFIKTGLIWFDFHKQFVYIFFSVIIWSTFLAIAWIHYLSI